MRVVSKQRSQATSRIQSACYVKMTVSFSCLSSVQQELIVHQNVMSEDEALWP